MLSPSAPGRLAAALLLLLPGLPAAQSLEPTTPWRVQDEREIAPNVGGVSYVPNAFDYFGLALGSIDLDGDGRREMIVGAPGYDGLGTDRGTIFVLFLNGDGSVRSQVQITEGLAGFAQPLDDSDFFGRGMADLGDLNGDGVRDLAVGAYRDDDGGFDSGALYVLFMQANGTVAAWQKISTVTGGLTAPVLAGDVFGIRAAGLGDLDGDGFEDVVACASLTDDGGNDRGAIYVLFLNGDGTVRDHVKIGRQQGGFAVPLEDDDYFGCDVACPGDVDGDGVVDLLVGAFGDDDGGPGTGAVYVLFLRSDGTVRDHLKIAKNQAGLGGVLDPGDNFGSSLGSLSELGGTGRRTVAVGSYRDDDGGTNAGAVWILELERDGSVRAKRKISNAAGGFGGVVLASENFGSAVAGLGDLDGNGTPDLGVGSWFDTENGILSGSAWILRLGPPARLAGGATRRGAF